MPVASPLLAVTTRSHAESSAARPQRTGCQGLRIRSRLMKRSARMRDPIEDDEWPEYDIQLQEALRIAADAIKAAQAPHHFLSVTKAGHSAIVSTRGNEDCHAILRGGKEPNFDAASVEAASRELAAAGVCNKVMVDFSHGNSRKQHRLQIEVAKNVANQLAAGDDRIMGVMVESHLKEGRQDLVPDKDLEYGKSITDACIGWEDSVEVLDILAEGVRQRRVKRAAEF